MEWNTIWNGIGNETLYGTDTWNRSGMEILCLEQLHETEVWIRCMEQIWNGNTLCGTAACNGSLEQMHGTFLELKYFAWNSCMERKSGTDAYNRSGTEILCLEQLHGTEV